MVDHPRNQDKICRFRPTMASNLDDSEAEACNRLSLKPPVARPTILHFDLGHLAAFLDEDRLGSRCRYLTFRIWGVMGCEWGKKGDGGVHSVSVSHSAVVRQLGPRLDLNRTITRHEPLSYMGACANESR